MKERGPWQNLVIASPLVSSAVRKTEGGQDSLPQTVLRDEPMAVATHKYQKYKESESDPLIKLASSRASIIRQVCARQVRETPNTLKISFASRSHPVRNGWFYRLCTESKLANECLSA